MTANAVRLYFTNVIVLHNLIVIIIMITSTSDLQPSTAISNQSPGKSFLNNLSLIIE